MSALYLLRDVLCRYPERMQRRAPFYRFLCPSGWCSSPLEERTVLDIPYLHIAAGEILGVKGANGSGKSTLLRLLAMLTLPSSGSVFFHGRATQQCSLTDRRKVTLLLQSPYLLSMTVAQNIAQGSLFRGERCSEADVRHALSMVGLTPDVVMHRFRNELSGGEAQRVALAARLLWKPQVLLMDEPTASVDEESAKTIRSVILKMKEQGTTIVVVSHDVEWLDSMTTRSITLRAGRIL